MRALVTGGGGFLGRKLVDLLRMAGHEVIVLCRRIYPALEAQGVPIVQADVADAGAVTAACSGCDVVFHLAAEVSPWGPARDFERTNVLGTRVVFDACLSAGVSRLVYTSTPSVAVGDEGVEGADETIGYARRFLSHYARTKAQAERELLSRNGTGGVHVCALRPHLIFGPGDRHMMPRLLAAARVGKLSQIGDGSNRVDVTYVDDAARAHLLAAEALEHNPRVAGNAYFISQGEPIRLWDWIRRLIARLGLPAVRRSIPYAPAYALGLAFELIYRATRLSGEPPLTRWLALNLGRPHWFDISAARRDLGYSPALAIADGFERLVQDLTAPAIAMR